MIWAHIPAGVRFGTDPSGLPWPSCELLSWGDQDTNKILHMNLAASLAFADSQPNYKENTEAMSSYCSFMISSGTNMNSVNQQLQVINAGWDNKSARSLMWPRTKAHACVLHQTRCSPRWNRHLCSSCIFIFSSTEKALLVQGFYSRSFASSSSLLFSTQI